MQILRVQPATPLWEALIDYARDTGFEYAYIPSDITGLYEKYGYELIDTLVNYGGDTDNVFRKKL